jgi:hypothetical protein
VPELREPLIPLSHLALDLAEPPASGWTVWLAERGIAVVFDDIGRPAISREDAKRLLDAQRQDEIRRQDHAARLEQDAVEKDRAFRASLPRGVAWHEVPPGLSPAQAMAAGDPDRDRRRKNPVAAMFDGDSMVVHSIRDNGDEFVARGNPEFFQDAS